MFWEGAEVQDKNAVITAMVKVLMGSWWSAETSSAPEVSHRASHHEYSGWGTTSWSKRLADLGRFVQWRPHEQGTGNGR
jgi:hypothetical protein